MNESIEALKKQIEDLKKRLPAHSIPPAMMAELDDQDKWQRTRLLFVAAGSSSQLNRQSLEQIVTLLDEEGQIQIMDAALEELE